MQATIFEPLLRKLGRLANLDQADARAINALPLVTETKGRKDRLVQEGEAGTNCHVLIAGYAFSQKLTSGGKRQIVALHLPGDFLNISQMVLGVSDYDVYSLSPVVAVSLRADALLNLWKGRPKIARALWLDTSIDASRHREWLVNIGRRDARARVAHFLCEFAARSEDVGIVSPGGFVLPMTQMDIGDATGLTAIHVNRTIGVMKKEGLVELGRQEIRIKDRVSLEHIADFGRRYLHDDQ